MWALRYNFGTKYTMKCAKTIETNEKRQRSGFKPAITVRKIHDSLPSKLSTIGRSKLGLLAPVPLHLGRRTETTRSSFIQGHLRATWKRQSRHTILMVNWSITLREKSRKWSTKQKDISLILLACHKRIWR